MVLKYGKHAENRPLYSLEYMRWSSPRGSIWGWAGSKMFSGSHLLLTEGVLRHNTSLSGFKAPISLNSSQLEFFIL